MRKLLLPSAIVLLACTPKDTATTEPTAAIDAPADATVPEGPTPATGDADPAQDDAPHSDAEDVDVDDYMGEEEPSDEESDDEEGGEDED